MEPRVGDLKEKKRIYQRVAFKTGDAINFKSHSKASWKIVHVRGLDIAFLATTNDLKYAALFYG